MIFSIKGVTPEALKAGNEDCFNAIHDGGKAEAKAEATASIEAAEKKASVAEAQLAVLKHGIECGQAALAIENIDKEDAIALIDSAKAKADEEGAQAPLLRVPAIEVLPDLAGLKGGAQGSLAPDSLEEGGGALGGQLVNVHLGVLALCYHALVDPASTSADVAHV